MLHDVLVLMNADDHLAPEVPTTLRVADLERRVDAPADRRREVRQEPIAIEDSEQVERVRDDLHLGRLLLVHRRGAEALTHVAPERADLVRLDVAPAKDRTQDRERLESALHRVPPA